VNSSLPFTRSAELATKPEPFDSPFALSLWFDKPVLSEAEGLTMIGSGPIVLSLSKEKLSMYG
jgi:hypothetical protein